ncbi:LysE family translocator [Vibrio mangrovi]|uniref:Homoserine/homoserine lactone efflux protein n=1 Tax=Vibrio mangrovi TaxID=474394 RepID=A0A1Y6IYH9_9VIBR|nr:LysE family translocator [Vibrio mangrovi]MDW6004811.1 LysE family translocator [Vibrio mangrovi]SMS01103.1 Homoserine/homoserine lactone efflux protein [Vibrio mangrovi]
MSVEIWCAFVLTASVILVIPGPTIIYVVGQSLTHGRKVSIPLSLGVILGDAICIILSFIGISTLLSLFSAALAVIKYIGAAYLIYLGLKMLVANSGLNNQKVTEAPFYHPKTLFRDVFFVNALNPKGIIFYSAFMPQFITPGYDVGFQFMLLAMTFLCLALINVTFYSLLAAKANELFRSVRFTKGFNVTGGLSLIFAGLYTATIEKR